MLFGFDSKRASSLVFGRSHRHVPPRQSAQSSKTRNSMTCCRAIRGSSNSVLTHQTFRCCRPFLFLQGELSLGNEEKNRRVRLVAMGVESGLLTLFILSHAQPCSATAKRLESDCFPGRGGKGEGEYRLHALLARSLHFVVNETVSFRKEHSWAAGEIRGGYQTNAALRLAKPRLFCLSVCFFCSRNEMHTSAYVY